jgi:hypothetical protein
VSFAVGLLMERDEFEQKVRLLGEKDDAMREANRRLLKKCSAGAQIANRGRWDDVVMLTGQRRALGTRIGSREGTSNPSDRRPGSDRQLPRQSCFLR